MYVSFNPKIFKPKEQRSRENYCVGCSRREQCIVCIIDLLDQLRERERDRQIDRQRDLPNKLTQQTLQMNATAGCQVRHQPINSGRPNTMHSKLLMQKFKNKNKNERENGRKK